MLWITCSDRSRADWPEGAWSILMIDLSIILRSIRVYRSSGWSILIDHQESLDRSFRDQFIIKIPWRIDQLHFNYRSQWCFYALINKDYGVMVSNWAVMDQKLCTPNLKEGHIIISHILVGQIYSLVCELLVWYEHTHCIIL